MRWNQSSASHCYDFRVPYDMLLRELLRIMFCVDFCCGGRDGVVVGSLFSLDVSLLNNKQSLSFEGQYPIS